MEAADKNSKTIEETEQKEAVNALQKPLSSTMIACIRFWLWRSLVRWSVITPATELQV